jgi:hypothetical protein
LLGNAYFNIHKIIFWLVFGTLKYNFPKSINAALLFEFLTIVFSNHISNNKQQNISRKAVLAPLLPLVNLPKLKFIDLEIIEIPKDLN